MRHAANRRAFILRYEAKANGTSVLLRFTPLSSSSVQRFRFETIFADETNKQGRRQALYLEVILNHDDLL